jgi:hypothetical protein
LPRIGVDIHRRRAAPPPADRPAAAAAPEPLFRTDAKPPTWPVSEIPAEAF